MNKKEAQAQVIDEKMLKEFVETFSLSPTTLKELKKISDEEMESIYAAGYSQYTHGRYKDAQVIFNMLTRLDMYTAKYWMGLGACRHMLKDYVKALETYMMAMIMDSKDPQIPFYAADCYIHLKEWEYAKSALVATLEICGEEKKHKNLRNQAQELLKGLEKKATNKKK